MSIEQQFGILTIAIALCLICTGVIIINRSSKSIYYWVMGFINCCISSVYIIAYFYKYSTLWLVMLIFLFVCLSISGTTLLKSTQRTFKNIAMIHLFALVVLTTDTAAVSYDHHVNASLKHHYNHCSKMIMVLENLQNEYHEDYGEYAVSIDQLYEYNNKNCHGIKDSCETPEMEQYNDVCSNVVLSIGKDGEYRIEARTKDRTNCYICITPKGWNRRYFEECKDEEKDYCI